MSDQISTEQRLTAMEHAVRKLQDRLDAIQGKSDWLQRLGGAFDDIPEADFQEFVRLGREFRDSDRSDDDELQP